MFENKTKFFLAINIKKDLSEIANKQKTNMFLNGVIWEKSL